MYDIKPRDVFSRWLAGLRDLKARARILTRVESAKLGHLGDTDRVAKGISEMRIHVGPGYRIYFSRQGEAIILLLCGGPKKSQKRDINRAVRILAELNQEEFLHGQGDDI